MYNANKWHYILNTSVSNAGMSQQAGWGNAPSVGHGTVL